MNSHHLIEICNKLGILHPAREPTRVYGGLLHLMWKLDVGDKAYAIKQLSKDLQLSENVVNNYELTENIAFQFSSLGVPAISAIEFAGKHITNIDGTAFLIYPWADAQALDKDAISKKHALQIPVILAKMHLINLDVPELSEPEFDIHQTESIIHLIDKAEYYDCSFSRDLRENQDNIAGINECYQKSILLLTKTVVVSHGDLDQKNVLWDKNGKPILIDWESARKLNPTYEMLDAALNWSGITTKTFDKSLFIELLKIYSHSGAVIDRIQVKAAFYGILGNWINWLVYNIKRVCKTDQNETDQRQMGIEQVEQTLKTILRVELMIAELMQLIETELDT